MADSGRGLRKVAEDEGIFAVDDRVLFADDLAMFTDRTGAFTLFNLVTRTLVAKVSVVDIDRIKSYKSSIVSLVGCSPYM
jgi:hypothetical protein